MAKTKSSQCLSLSLRKEVSDAVKSIATKKSVSISDVLRDAVYDYLESRGYYFRRYNPTRGQRTDLFFNDNEH